MTRAVLQALFSHWRRHPVQALAWVTGLLLATALWSGVQALNTQARDSYDRAAGLFAGAALPHLASASGAVLPDTVFGRLRRAGWPVSPLLEGRLTLGDQTFRLIGIDPVTLPAEASAGQAVSTDDFRLSDFLTPPGLLLGAAPTLADLSRAMKQAGTGAPELPPRVTSADIPPGTLLADMGIAQQLLDQPGRISRLLVPSDARVIKQAPPGDDLNLIWQTGQSESDLGRLTDSFHLNLSALGLLAFVVGLFIVHSATGLAFQQRHGLFRTLRACGVSQRALMLALLTEMVVMALIAGSLGLTLGYQIARVLIPDVAATLAGLYGARIGDQLSLQASWWWSGLSMTFFGALLATLTHLWQVARLPILARAEARHRAAEPSRYRQVGAGLGLWCVALVLTLFAHGLWWAFAGLAALLLGAAFCLPAVLALCLRAGQHLARRPLAQWFWAEARQQMHGLTLALMALLLALSASVGVGGMVDGFRLTFTQWLDQRLVAEAYLNARSVEQANAMQTWLEAQPEVRAILPFAEVQTRFRKGPLQITGLTPHPTYTEAWPLLDATNNAWAEFARGQGVFISEQMARRHNLEPGDTLTLGAATNPWALTVVGRYPDYGNPRPEIRVATEHLLRWHRGTAHRGFHVRVPAEQTRALVNRGQAKFPDNEQAIIDQASLKRFSTGVFDQTFVVTGAINSLTLGVAALAMLTSLLTLGQARLPQLAPLWAMGLTRRRLVALEWLRTLGLASLTIVLAIPLGVVLTWYLVSIINVEAFGWQLPLYLFPGQWLRLALLALAATLLASALPAWQLVRRPSAHWLRLFATEH